MLTPLLTNIQSNRKKEEKEGMTNFPLWHGVMSERDDLDLCMHVAHMMWDSSKHLFFSRGLLNAHHSLFCVDKIFKFENLRQVISKLRNAQAKHRNE